MSTKINVIETSYTSLNDEELDETLNSFSDSIPIVVLNEFKDLYRTETPTVRSTILKGIRHSGLYRSVHGHNSFSSYWQNPVLVPSLGGVDGGNVNELSELSGLSELSELSENAVGGKESLNIMNSLKKPLKKARIKTSKSHKVTLSPPITTLDGVVFREEMNVNGFVIAPRKPFLNYDAQALINIGAYNADVLRDSIQNRTLNIRTGLNTLVLEKPFMLLYSYIHTQERRAHEYLIPPFKQVGEEWLLILQKLINGVFSENSYLTDMFVRNLSSIYYSGIIRGIEHPETQNLIELYKINSAKKLFENKINRENTRLNLKLSVYASIIQKLFPAEHAKIQRVLSLPGTKLSEVLIQSVLNKKQQDRLILEYDSFLRKMESVGSACKHRQITVQLRKATEIKRINRLLDSLENYSQEVRQIRNNLRKDGSSMSSMSSMSGISTKASGISRGNPVKPLIQCNDCKDVLICPHVVISYALTGAPAHVIRKHLHSYVTPEMYCRVCGESMDTIEELDLDEIDAMKGRDQELLDKIWSNAQFIMKYFNIGPYINVKNLITQVRDKIYPFIFDIEKMLMKSKTATAEEIAQKKKLYITTYAVAQMVRITEKTSIEFGKSNKTVDLLKRAIDTITLSLSYLKKINISNDAIGKLVISAYKTLSDGITLEKETNDVDIEFDPLRNAIVVGLALTKNKPIREIEKSDIMKVSVGKAKKDQLESVDSPIVQIAERAEKVISGKYQSYVNTVKAVLGKYKGTASVDFTKTVAKNKTAYGDIHDKDRSVNKIKTLLSNVYDEDGIKHKFNIYVVSVSSNDNSNNDNSKLSNKTITTELSLSELVREQASGKKIQLKDRRCGICKVLYSERGLLDEKKIKESLRAAALVDSFLAFYRERCPIGGMHEYTLQTTTTSTTTSTTTTPTPSTITTPTQTKCTKCGIDIANTSTVSKENILLFRKYQSKYFSDRSEVADVKLELNIKPPSDVVNTTGDFVFNFEKLNKLANIFNIKVNFLSSLGAIERIDISTIDTYIPPPPEDKHNTRLYLLDSYARSIIVNWYQIKLYSKFLSKLNPLSALLKNSQVRPENLAKLPDIGADYMKNFYSARMHLAPPDAINFLLETICDYILTIHSTTDGSIKKLCTDFAKYTIDKLLKNDELNTKPGNFSFTKMFGDQKPSVDAINGTLTEATSGDVENLRADSDDEAAFGYDAYDMEADPEDGDNDIKVEFNGLD